MTYTQLSGQVPDVKVQMYMSCGALPKLVILLILHVCNFHKDHSLLSPNPIVLGHGEFQEAHFIYKHG